MLDLKKLLYKILSKLNTLTSEQTTINGRIDDVKTHIPSKEGTSGKWYYRLWDDGRYEMWYDSGATTITTTTSGGNGWYRNSSEYTINLPDAIPYVSINTVRHAEISVNSSYAYLITSITHANSTYLGFYVSHLGSLSSVSVYVSAYVMGSWGWSDEVE